MSETHLCRTRHCSHVVCRVHLCDLPPIHGLLPMPRSSRGSLKILFSTTPEQTTLGLDQYTHCWVLWLFHDNVNRAVRPLVHPPRLDGDKQVLAPYQNTRNRKCI